MQRKNIQKVGKSLQADRSIKTDPQHAAARLTGSTRRQHEEEVMTRKSSRIVLALPGAAALGLAGLVQADEHGGSPTPRGTVIKSRGADAAHADLMRDWSYKGRDEGRSITLRTDAALTADLMREWDGPAHIPALSRKAPHSRAVESAYDDLMRNWGG
jgi:hypothetical protein